MADSQDFRIVLDEMWKLHQKKSQDYGSQEDPYRNIRSGTNWGTDPWISAQIRLGDKTQRLQNYAQTGELSNEGAEDSLIDLAVYAVISLVLWREQYKERVDQGNLTAAVDLVYGDKVVNAYPVKPEFVSPKSGGC